MGLRRVMSWGPSNHSFYGNSGESKVQKNMKHEMETWLFTWRSRDYDQY